MDNLQILDSWLIHYENFVTTYYIKPKEIYKKPYTCLINDFYMFSYLPNFIRQFHMLLI